MDEKRVAIFCAASTKVDEKYNAAAREAVRALHALNYTVLSGGGRVGIMGAITDESVRCGGRHISVLPSFMKGLENPDIQEIIWTETMSERKEIMRKDTCAVIALPGGIGTLDELIETQTLRKLHRYEGNIYALNIYGFFDPYIELMDHMVQENVLEPEDRDLVFFPRTVAELLACFK